MKEFRLYCNSIPGKNLAMIGSRLLGKALNSEALFRSKNEYVRSLEGDGENREAGHES